MKRLVLTISVFTGIVFSLTAQVDRTKAPNPGPTPKVVVGTYESFDLPNGLKVIVVENHRLPKVNYTLVIDYDPILEKEYQGFVDIAGNLIGKGTTNRTKDQINDEIDFIGANLNFSSQGLSASCLKKHNEKLLDIMSDALINAVFSQEELDKIKKQSLSALAAARKEPGAISDRVDKALMFGKSHPYGNSETEQSIESITLDKCKDFYNTLIRPNISYLAIVGDINLLEAKTLVTKYFSGWKASDVPKTVYPAPMPPKEPTFALVDRQASVQSLIKVCYPVKLKVGDEDYIKARVANTILGGGTFRLFNNLREKHGYTYGSYSQLSPDKVIGSFTASAEVRNSATDSAITEILYEMNRMRTEKVPEDELSMVKNYASGTFALSLENPQTIANFALNIERFKLPRDYYQNYMQRIAAVNSDDIMQVAKKYILPENSYILVVGKAEEIAKPLSILSKSGKVEYYDFDGNPVDMNKKIKPAPVGTTAQMVLEKYLNATGGRKKISKITDMTVTMSTNMQGMPITIKSCQKGPDKLMIEVGSGGMTFSKTVFDGTKGSMTSPMGTQDMTGEDLESLKYQAILNIELNYEKYGVSLNLLGIEDIKGKEAYKIELTYPGGKKETEYYDMASSLRVRKISSDGQTDYSDYKAVKEILFPFVMEQEMGGQMVKLNVDSVEINTKPDDKLFKL